MGEDKDIKEKDIISTGIVRQIDELGRFVLPHELRKRMNLKEKDMIEIMHTDKFIILGEYKIKCKKCGNLLVDKEKDELLCQSCTDELYNKYHA